MLMYRKGVHSFLLAEVLQLRQEDPFMRAARPWKGYWVTVLPVSFGDMGACLCQELTGTEHPGAPRLQECLSGASRVMLPGTGLSVARTISPTRSDQSFMGGSSELRAWDQVLGTTGGTGARKTADTCPGLPGTSHFIEEMEYLGKVYMMVGPELCGQR